jgi:hypothetical protein
MKTDFNILNCGSVVMVYPLTEQATNWVNKNVYLEPWQWLGGGFAVEPRYFDNLYEGIINEGLTIE